MNSGGNDARALVNFLQAEVLELNGLRQENLQKAVPPADPQNFRAMNFDSDEEPETADQAKKTFVEAQKRLLELQIPYVFHPTGRGTTHRWLSSKGEEF